MDAVIEYVPVGKATVESPRKDIGEVKPSQAYNLGYFVRYGLCAVALVVVYALLPGDPSGWVLAVPLLLLGLRAVHRWVDLACLSYRFDGGERVEVSWGILSRNTSSLEVFRIQNVSMRQSFFERMAGVGTVVLETRDETNPVLSLIGMRRPDDLRRSLTEYVQKARRARGVQEASVN